MKTYITKQELTSGLSFIAGIPRRSSVPILQNVLISKSDNVLSFSANDMEVFATSHVSTEQGESFEFTVDCDRLNKVVSSLPSEGKITLDIDDGKIAIKAGRSKFSIQTLPADDFPAVKLGERKGCVTVKQEELKRIMQSVAPMMAKNDVRYYLNGALLECKAGVLSAVGTNGHALGMDSMALDYADFEHIMPSATVARLIKMLGNGDMTMEFYDARIKFNINGNCIIANLIEGKFPDYRRVVPENHVHSVTVDKEQFVESCKRASVSTDDKFRAISISFGKTMRFSGSKGIEESSDDFDIDYQGEEFDAGFNVDYLLNCAAGVDSDSLTLRFTDSRSSLLVDGGTYKAVVMPMRM